MKDSPGGTNMNLPKEHVHAAITPWRAVMLVLCVYVLGAVFADTAFDLPEEISRLISHFDTLVCLVFLGDFTYNFFTAKSKLSYLKWGWIDLLSSIPYVPWLRWGRSVSLIRMLRILRAARSVKVILQVLFVNPVKGTLASVALISFALVIFSSIAILNCETAPDSNIRTASDALWWSFVTISTVGYGDLYPVTFPGRILAAIMMMAGVGLFGTFTAYVASFFLEQGEQEERKREKAILEELRLIREKLECLEEHKK